MYIINRFVMTFSSNMSAALFVISAGLQRVESSSGAGEGAVPSSCD